MTTNDKKAILGQPVSRVDGVLKVTGQARYAAEQQHSNSPYVGWLVSSDTAVGEITRLETQAAEQAEGVVAVITYKNAGPLKPFSKPADESRFTQSRAVLHEPHIRHYGAPVALVVAQTLEQARYAASLVSFSVEGTTPDLLLEPEQAQTDPETLDGGFEPDVSTGELSAEARGIHLSASYTTPSQISAAMEPHATVASFDGNTLTVNTSVQIVASAVEALAITLEMEPENIIVKSPYVGGGFGSKLGLHYDAILACIGARKLRHPVKVVLSRRQVFYNTPHRGNSFQSMTLRCDEQGKFSHISHKSAMPRAKGYAFAEATGAVARVTYSAENITSTHRVKDVDLPLIDSTRSPGDAIGSLTFESAVDELALKAGVDPLEFRLRNIPDKHPVSKTRFTSHRLADCLTQGAEKFGWQNKPDSHGEVVYGHGVASAMRINMLTPSSASIELTKDGQLTVRSDMTDIGTGTYTILAQIAANTLGVDVDNVSVELGDSRAPASCGSGGSFGAASTGSALLKACQQLRSKLESASGLNENSDVLLQGDKLVITGSGKTRRLPLSTLFDSGAFPLKETGEVGEEDTSDDEQYSCGAHFAEVAVNISSGEVRIKRQYGMFSAGKILNSKTAASQIKGGMVWGAGYALTEAIHHHNQTASFLNPDFGEYHIAVNRDIGEVSLDFIEESDFEASPVGAKGIGELGITGAGAAIANAIADACGARVREFPITLDKVMAKMRRSA